MIVAGRCRDLLPLATQDKPREPQQPGSAEGEAGLQTVWKELQPTPQLHAADDPIY